MKVFLIGFMGAGKTTFGKKLAKKLKCPFFDLDHLIEEITGSTVGEYFAAHGEVKFRELEKEILQTHPLPENFVLSTGGGAPCFHDNMDWMNENGQTIYLQLTPKALATRLENAKEDRPLIKGLTGDDLIKFISDRLETRDIYYKKAHFIVDGLNVHPEIIANLISKN